MNMKKGWKMLILFVLASGMTLLFADIGSADTLTLRPDGVGSETALPTQYPSSGAHWDKVNETTSDGDATYVASATGGAWRRDLYTLSDASQTTETINSVEVYGVVKAYSGSGLDRLQLSIRTYGTTYNSILISIDSTYTTYYRTLTTNPNTGSAWTWTEINNLEAGANLQGFTGNLTYMTQVYVVVDYKPPAKGGLFQLFE